jgi:L-ribulose-5-phosphate 3-epimerase
MKPYQISLYEKAMPAQLAWREKAEAAHRAGFDALEISIDETEERLARLHAPEAELRAMTACRKAGAPIRSMCLSAHRRYPLGSRDPDTARRSLSIAEQAILLAEKVGIRMIQLAGYDVYYEAGDDSTHARFLENLKRVAAMAACRGVLLGFETMETDFMNTAQKAMGFVETVNSPYLGVYPDIGNITNAVAGSSAAACLDLNAAAGHLVALHLKETRPGVFREVPFGTGHVDFPAAISTAWQLGVRRYTVECWYTGSDAWAQELADVNQKMRSILDRQ